MAGTAGPLTTAVATALVVGLLVTGCGAAAGSGTPTAAPGTAAPAPLAPSPSEAAPADVVPTVDSVRADGTVVQVGDAAVIHAAPVAGATTQVAAEGDVVILTVHADPPGTPVAVLLAAPAGAELAVQEDGSFVVLASDGAFVGGGARPVTVADGARASLAEVADGVVRASTDGGDLRLRLGADALAGAEWGQREGGRSLAVSPTPWAREAGQAGEAGVWAELVAAVPEVDTTVMRDQLVCHVFGAPDKETWNLEPWRPDVGLLGVLAAGCNPT